mmetsp:Transcript_9269/g.20025  ORF Transcript_9269/g.20025 Transcript_9269/m.20025 type:complete len:96 (+) Transcript_9269:1113-1400(+)
MGSVPQNQDEIRSRLGLEKVMRVPSLLGLEKNKFRDTPFCLDRFRLDFHTATLLLRLGLRLRTCDFASSCRSTWKLFALDDSVDTIGDSSEAAAV